MSSGSVTNATSSAGPSDLDKKMQQLLSSNDPKDIATLAYIWGYPLISNIRTIDGSTDPAHYNDSQANGPWNQFHYRTQLANANFTQIVGPNVDTLYSNLYYDLEKQPVVISVPEGINRYFSLQFIEVYTNNFQYIGTRTTEDKGGTYLLTGPNWNGTVPDNMMQIKSPTNFGLVFGRTLVDGPDDLQKAIAVQQSIKAAPLDVYENKTSSAGSVEDPIAFYKTSLSGLPQFIPPTGVKLFNELAYYIAKNMPPSNESQILEKFAMMGIVPSTDLNNKSAISFNETGSKALLQGISDGERLIDSKFGTFGRVANGWNIDTSNVGQWDGDYLFRATITKFGLWANSPQEAVYPNAVIGSDGKPLNGANDYVIHFGKGELPPVNKGGFWSMTIYNKDRLLHDNPINRYVINDRTPGLHYGDDGSLDIYLQNQKPTESQEANWLPIPQGPFSVQMRIYIPTQAVLDGQWSPPPIQLVL